MEVKDRIVVFRGWGSSGDRVMEKNDSVVTTSGKNEKFWCIVAL